MKYVIAALGLIAGLPQAALADETSNTEQLKQMLDELAADKPSDEVYQAFLEKWLASSVGETGIWVDYRKTEFEDDRSRSGKSADSYSRVIGIDHRLTPRVTVGFALMNLDTDTSTTPSNDAFEGYSTIDDDSRGFAFMGQYTLKSWLAMSGSVTVLETETDITDYSTAAPPSTKSTDGDSVTLDLGANVFAPLAPRVMATGRLGFTYQHGDQDGYDDEFGRRHDSQTYESGTVSLDTGLHYRITPRISPYASVKLGYDVISDEASPALVRNPGGSLATSAPFQEKRDRFSYGYETGVRWAILRDLSLDVSYRQQYWGSDVSTDTFGGNLRYQF